jgi:FkbM family methyltransferase
VLEPGDLVIDAGAYKGGYTYWMRDAVGATGRVIAFEPQPELAAFLERMVVAFRWDNVQVEPMGLSSGRAARTLFVPGAGASQRASLEWEREGARAYDVALISLDDYAADHLGRRPVALVKCDVEGHELDVFRGARRIVEAYRPILLFECEARHAPGRSVREVFEHLETSGYAGSFFLDDELVPVKDFRPAVHQVPGRRPYVNNSVFVPDARRQPEAWISPRSHGSGSRTWGLLGFGSDVGFKNEPASPNRGRSRTPRCPHDRHGPRTSMTPAT